LGFWAGSIVVENGGFGKELGWYKHPSTRLMPIKKANFSADRNGNKTLQRLKHESTKGGDCKVPASKEMCIET